MTDLLNMFNFLRDNGTYKDRCVARNEFDWGYISTAYVSDGKKPYETAVMCTDYVNDKGEDDKMIIVEAYESKAGAEAGHKRWVETMENNPPAELIDCMNAGIAQLLEGFGEEIKETRKTK